METERFLYKRFFEEMIKLLNKHYKEPGAEDALEYVRAAQFNYLHGSPDHMITSLMLAFDQIRQSRVLSEKVWSLVGVFNGRAQASGAVLRRIAEEYEKKGGKPLSQVEIIGEVRSRRGA